MRTLTGLVLVSSLFLQGCLSFDPVALQPGNFKFNDSIDAKQVLDIQADEIVLKSPKKITEHKDGSVTTEPIMRTHTVTTSLLDSQGVPIPGASVTTTDQEPVLARLRVKDTSFKEPMGAYEFGMAITKVALAGFLGGELIAGIVTMGEYASKAPILVPPTIVRPEVVHPEIVPVS